MKSKAKQSISEFFIVGKKTKWMNEKKPTSRHLRHGIKFGPM